MSEQANICTHIRHGKGQKVICRQTADHEATANHEAVGAMVEKRVVALANSGWAEKYQEESR